MSCGVEVTDAVSTKPLTRRLAVVLGMHRSGTSVLTRGLKTLSFVLGDDLMPPTDDNPTGFFEDLRFYRLNKAILKRINLQWDSLTRPDPTVLTSRPFLKARKNAIALLNNQLELTPNFALKDPRFCQLLSFWKPVFYEAGVDPCYVISVRHPYEVAQSLLRRNDIPTADGIFLWFNHMLAAVVDTQESKRVFVSYDRLLGAPQAELIRLAEACEMPRPKTDAVTSFCERFLDPRLRHHEANETSQFETHGSYDLVLQFYETLEELAYSRPCEPVGMPPETLNTFATFRNQIERLYERIDELKSPLHTADANSGEKPVSNPT